MNANARDRQRARDLLRRFGRDVVAWQGLESSCRYWFAEHACVAYVDTGSAWVAAGTPWCEPTAVARIAREFMAAAHQQGRRACFFAVERPEQFEAMATLRLGEQARFEPQHWPETLARHRRLREQLRRASKKGVRVRRVAAEELAVGSPLRTRVEAIGAAWLQAQHLEPLGFVAAVEPFDLPAEHRYYLAERDGGPIAFMSLVPVPAARGWLVEDTFRGDRVPNGTTELLLDTALREAGDDAFVSLGLAPLSGPLPLLLRAARAIGAPLYDFKGLRRFKQRLHPTTWQPVWLMHAPRQPVRAVADSLRAFAGGGLLAFGLRSLVRHPSGPPWLLAVPLVPWTLLLALLAVLDDGRVLGFSQPALLGWVLWDGWLAWQLFRTARRPWRIRLWWLAAAAAVDAGLSIAHLHDVGLGSTVLSSSLRLASTLAPVGGTVALVWAAARTAATK